MNGKINVTHSCASNKLYQYYLLHVSHFSLPNPKNKIHLCFLHTQSCVVEPCTKYTGSPRKEQVGELLSTSPPAL